MPVERQGVTESSSSAASPRPTKPEIGGSGGQPVMALSSISTALGGAGGGGSSSQPAPAAHPSITAASNERRQPLPQSNVPPRIAAAAVK